MSVDLPDACAHYKIGFVVQDEPQIFKRQFRMDALEHGFIHFVGQLVVVALDEDDASIQALPVFPQVSFVAFAKVASLIGWPCPS